MQTELFATTVPDPAPKPKRKRPRREIIEPVSLGIYSFDTWVSFPARAVNAEDGLRIEFTVPVHSDLLEAVNNSEKTEITCKYRVRKGFKWGSLGRRAEVRIEAHLTQGPKGGLYLHCKQVEILKPVKIGGEPLPRSIKKMIKSIQKLC